MIFFIHIFFLPSLEQILRFTISKQMSYNTQVSKTYSDVILLKKAKSKWTNIFPAPVIKQTLPHKHNKHRKPSFLSAIQATPSHC